MKHLIRQETATTMRLGAAALALAAAIAAAAIAAAPGNAAPAGKASYPAKPARFQRPKLSHGVLAVTGTKARDSVALRLEAGAPDIVEVDVGDDGSADFSFRRTKVASIVVNAGPGNDIVRIDESNGVFTDTIATTVNGGAGNDTLLGGAGAETLVGGSGNDTIDGNGGNDRAALGAGNDTFIWDPGDGSDTIEGGTGADTMRFNGANADEQVDLSANGNRLRFFRTQGNITMDTAGVERVDFNALGGADRVTVNDLSATDVTDVRLDLAGTLGGSAGDGRADHVVVNATDGDDAITVNGDAGGVKASRLATTVAILHPEAADVLAINTLAGRDRVDASGLAVGTLQLFVDAVRVQ